MEHNNNQPLEFDVISNDDKIIVEAIAKYNKMYKTDFEIVKFIYDEVVFARLKVTRYEVSDIFQLGYYFNALVDLKRQKGEIDW